MQTTEYIITCPRMNSSNGRKNAEGLALADALNYKLTCDGNTRDRAAVQNSLEEIDADIIKTFGLVISEAPIQIDE